MTFFNYLIRASVILLMFGTICACGQKGKLVLPVKPPAISTPYPTTQPKEVNEEPGAEQATESTPDTAMEPTPISKPGSTPDVPIPAVIH